MGFRSVFSCCVLVFVCFSVSTVAAAHTAPHGGSLSVIERCSVGHVEVITDGDTMKLWFLDSGDDTSRAVRVSELRVPLSIVTQEGERIEITLICEPLRLAGERQGNSSHFVGRTPQLKDLKSFEAYGWVMFKGRMRPIHISHPAGRDPDHAPQTGQPHQCDDDHTNCSH